MSAAYDSVPYEVATAILAPVSSGELGGGVALELRGLLGANLVQYASLATPLVLASAELGASVRFR